jgi:DNA-binding transcriptional LysR family regulator
MLPMLNFNDLVFFVRVAESGGFTAAARLLGLPKSTVSKRVGFLEAQLGARLLHRTSRRITLTDVGRDVLQHASAALIEAEAAEAAVHRRLGQPSGIVRLTASVPVAQDMLAHRLPKLAQAHPDLLVQLHVTDRFVDLVHEGFDIAVRSHFAPLPDSSLVQRQIDVDPVVLVASPDYLRAHGTPDAPASLPEHRGLITGPAAPRWRLRGPAGAVEEVQPRAAMVADESWVLLRAAQAGLGIACLPQRMCQAQLDDGSLTRVLPQWTAGSVTTTLLMPARRGQLPAVRVVVEALSAPWPS